MPIPFLIPAALAAIGIKSHMSAKEKNEKAQKTVDMAKSIYNNEKYQLERVQEETAKILSSYGETKNNIYNGTISHFVKSYEKIKDIRFNKIDDLGEISKFMIDDQGKLELVEMTNIYNSTLASAGVGATSGAMLALAVNGSLPLVTGTLSLAGTALTFGEFGTALSLAGSSLSLGATLTPFSAIAAPVVLFTGFTSNMKANENLEKAIKLYTDAEVAVEQMKNSIVLCESICIKTKMFNELLLELNTFLAACNDTLDRMISKKSINKNGKINLSKLTKKDFELIAVTRSLAGAIKTVLDTPILDDEGKLSQTVESTYEAIGGKLSDFRTSTARVCSKKNHLLYGKNKSNKKVKNKEKKLSRFVKKLLCLIIILIFLFYLFGGSGNDEYSKVDNKNGSITNSEPIQNSIEDIQDKKDETNTENLVDRSRDVIIYGNLTSDIKWEVDKEGTLNIIGNGNLPDVDRKSEIFSICLENNVNKIIIQEGIKEIGNNNFAELSIDEIILPSSLEKIGNSAFTNSYIKKITIPSNVRYIGHNAFSYCFNLSSVYIENSNVEIENYAFDYSNNVVIYGKAESKLEQYANENGIKFIGE